MIYIYLFRWADNMSSIGLDGKPHPFNHPFVQSLSMFLGEFLCLLFFKLAYRYHIKRQVSYFFISSNCIKY